MQKKKRGTSGGAIGADAAWTEAAVRAGWHMTVYSFPGHNRRIPPLASKNISIQILTAEELQTMAPHVDEIRRTVTYRANSKNPYVVNLLLRDGFVVKDVGAVYAVGRLLESGMVEGGTGGTVYLYIYLMEMAELPIHAWLFDMNSNQWLLYEATTKTWKVTEPPEGAGDTLCAFIGSRNLTEQGHEAIKRFFDTVEVEPKVKQVKVEEGEEVEEVL